MGRRSFTEAFHLVTGLVVTLAVFRVAAAAYPIGRSVVNEVGWATVLVVLVMGIGPLRDAWRADREGNTMTKHDTMDTPQ